MKGWPADSGDIFRRLLKRLGLKHKGEVEKIIAAVMADGENATALVPDVDELPASRLEAAEALGHEAVHVLIGEFKPCILGIAATWGRIQEALGKRATVRIWRAIEEDLCDAVGSEAARRVVRGK